MKAFKWIALVIVLVLVVVAMISWKNNFELRKTGIIKQGKIFQDNSQIGEGLWLFHRLLERDFEQVRTTSGFDAIPADQPPSLLINFTEHYYGQSDQIKSIQGLVESGHTILLSSYSYNIGLDSLREKSQVEGKYNHVSLQLEGRNYDFPLFEREGDWYKKYKFERLFRIWDSIPLPNTLSGDIAQIKSVKKEGFDLKRQVEGVPIVQCASYGEGQICFHNIPYLFTNIASEQEGYYPHYREVMDIIGKEEIWFINPSAGESLPNQASPLQHILKSTSLKWAYYLTWFTALIFLFIGSKRINPPIPVRHDKSNDLIQYVKTLSLLFQKAKANHFVGGKIQDNFFKYVREKYFLNKEDPDFWERLVIKSGLNNDYIFKIKDTFNSVDGNTDPMDNDRLLRLDQLLEKFYKKTEEWSIRKKN